MKRKASGGPADARQKKKFFIKQAARGKFVLHEGIRGVLVTCDPSREKRAFRELITAFEQIADELFPLPDPECADGADDPAGEESDEEEDSGPIDIAGALRAEVAEMKHAKAANSIAKGGSRFRHEPASFGVRGRFIIIVRDKAIDTGVLVRELLVRVRDGAVRASLAERVLPIDGICRAEEAILKERLEPQLTAILSNRSNRTNYTVLFTRKLNDSVNRDSFTDAVKEVFGEGHTFRYKEYSVVVVLNVVKTFVMWSILRDYDDLGKYNVRSMVTAKSGDVAESAGDRGSVVDESAREESPRTQGEQSHRSATDETRTTTAHEPGAATAPEEEADAEAAHKRDVDADVAPTNPST